METVIREFSAISNNDIALVGGKNASLGEMYNRLRPKGINVPPGFAITVEGYRQFLSHNNLKPLLGSILSELDTCEFSNLEEVGKKVRNCMLMADLPPEVAGQIQTAYLSLCGPGEKGVAARSSATTEDLVTASFAGQHDSFLNITSASGLLTAVKRCYASLYNDRAIKYRHDKGFEHDKVLISVGVQLMVRSDLACSGIGFTLEPESGFTGVVHLAACYGLGDNIVQGFVTPDEYLVFKPSLAKGKKAILQRRLGSKSLTMIYSPDTEDPSQTVNTDTSAEKQSAFALADEEVEQLARWAADIESHYGRPMDIEWAKDGINGQLYILQARPETVHGSRDKSMIKSYSITTKAVPLASGQAVGSAVASGYARVLEHPGQGYELGPEDILVTDITTPDWDPILKKVAGIVTNKGGRTSHASIVARELGVAAIVGTGGATGVIKDGDYITLSCAQGKTGYIYPGKIAWAETLTDISTIHLSGHPKVQLITGEPEKAFELSFLPNDGVGLLRMEFIISNYVKLHPMACVHPERSGIEESLMREIIAGYANGSDYFTDKLSQGLATIAAAFYPKEVIVRLSDFKTNEYAGLPGGKAFEPEEENPTLGFRGASRYYHPLYREGFELECRAIKYVRETMGLDNVKVMVPFCRTPQEGQKVLQVMEGYGLKRGTDRLEVYVMAEIPSNILQADAFCELFDGFSIGSNDLTQLTLGIDRDSSLIAGLFDEHNPAATMLVEMLIRKASELHKKVGLCGQAPSDSPAYTEFLVKTGITAISFVPDALIRGIENINQAKARL